MVVRQPLLQRRWQQQLLVGFVGKVGFYSSTTPRYWTAPIIPPNTRQPCFSDGLLVNNSSVRCLILPGRLTPQPPLLSLIFPYQLPTCQDVAAHFAQHLVLR